MAKLSASRLILLSVLASGACTVQQAEIPPLAGPSELALSLLMTATPDLINQDGASQSAIAVTARDANGRAVSSMPLRVEITVGGVGVDYGTLSARTIITGADGIARVVYTAPPPPPPTAGGSGTLVTIYASPIGSNYQTVNFQNVDIRLVPPGVILPPANTPTAEFTFSPTSPQANSPVQFDASPSCGGACESYSWNFGDGGTATGRLVTHAFPNQQTYSVTLTVTNGGRSASSTRPVTVGAGALPAAAFVFSPTSPTVGQQIYFDASTSQPGAGHRIVRYDWSWGDGESQTGMTTPAADHDYQTSGTFTVVLTVTDEVGQQGVNTRTISVGSGSPTAAFTVTTAAAPANTKIFNGSSSTAVSPATIASYAWDFGDGSSGTGVTPTKTYAAVGTYTVRLTVTDSLGRSGATTASVTVP